jgi:hypothetical protein
MTIILKTEMWPDNKKTALACNLLMLYVSDVHVKFNK